MNHSFVVIKSFILKQLYFAFSPYLSSTLKISKVMNYNIVEYFIFTFYIGIISTRQYYNALL